MHRRRHRGLYTSQETRDLPPREDLCYAFCPEIALEYGVLYLAQIIQPFGVLELTFKVDYLTGFCQVHTVINSYLWI